MDRREDMDKGTRYPYYMFQSGFGPGPQVQTQSRPTLFGQPGIFLSSGPNLNAPVPPPDTGGGHFPPTVQGEPASVQQYAHSQGGIAQGELAKKKRGRPRKYDVDGTMAPGFSSGSSVARLGSVGGSESEFQPGSAMSTPKRGRGRPRGSGSRQKLASIGGLMLSSAGSGFKPHVLKVSAGEDIAAKIMAFSQKGSKTVCILSASGVISMVTFHLPSGNSMTYEGQFEILSLTGSYVFGDDVISQIAHGGLSICLSNSEFHVFGGQISGRLLAASPVQLIIASFSHNGTKAMQKPEAGLQPDAESEPTDAGDGDQQLVCSNPTAIEDLTLNTVRSGPGQMGTRSIPRDIDLTRAVNI